MEQDETTILGKQNYKNEESRIRTCLIRRFFDFWEWGKIDVKGYERELELRRGKDIVREN